ncbi:MAG: TatD family hydrolase [Ruminococcus sp.]|nr:TatD family hydrolase [Ruminococcus sp.]
MNNIFDAHAHFDDDWFDSDREELLESLPSKGVSAVVNAAVDLKTAKIAQGFAEKYDYMYFTVGFHPENLEDMPSDYLQQIAKMLEHKKAVALGEIGLDYHWDIEKSLQQRVFEEQLKLSKELDVPVVIHDREAHGDVLNMLIKYKPKGLMHCFSGSVEMLKEVLKLGMSISLGGTVTFKNARVPVEVAQAVALDRLLLETDSPYLSPVPFRGKRNDSSNIIYTATKIAEIKGIGVQQLLDITAENAKKLYEIE